MKSFLTLTLFFLLISVSSQSQEYFKGLSNIERNLPEDEKAEDEKPTNTKNDWLSINDITLYGGGSLLNQVTGKSDDGETTSTNGSIGLSLNSDRIITTVYFSYNGKKTIEMNSREQFGSALMLPNLAGESLALSIFCRPWPEKTILKRFRFGVDFIIADNIWKLDSINSVDASPLVVKAGTFIYPFDINPSNEDNIVDLYLGAFFTHRSIKGDFGNFDQNVSDLYVPTRGYNGLELSLNLRLNNVKLKFGYCFNPEKDKEQYIPGFSGNQVVFGVDVIGDILNL